jgi:hypothetical protein
MFSPHIGKKKRGQHRILPGFQDGKYAGMFSSWCEVLDSENRVDLHEGEGT